MCLPCPFFALHFAVLQTRPFPTQLPIANGRRIPRIHQSTHLVSTVVLGTECSVRASVVVIIARRLRQRVADFSRVRFDAVPATARGAAVGERRENGCGIRAGRRTIVPCGLSSGRRGELTGGRGAQRLAIRPHLLGIGFGFLPKEVLSGRAWSGS